ncbi:hypothetical protein ACP70R_010624 [Stipagrostis hirtigluma subsp. patula]
MKISPLLLGASSSSVPLSHESRRPVVRSVSPLPCRFTHHRRLVDTSRRRRCLVGSSRRRLLLFDPRRCGESDAWPEVEVEAEGAVVVRAREKDEEKVEEKKAERRLPLAAQLGQHPLAVLALVPNSAALFAAAAAAGAAAKTVAAPLNHVELLMQCPMVKPGAYWSYLLAH